MRGLETSFMYGLLIFVAVIIIIVIIVIIPSLGFGKSTQSRTSFEQFCIFWSLNNYEEGWTDEVTALPQSITPRTPEENCKTVLGITATEQDIDRCRSCCKKEIVC